MNQRLTELYRSCRPKEALASQDAYGSADVLLGTEVAKFAELIVAECAEVAQMNTPDTEECEYTHLISEKIKEHFGVEL